jgi:cell wall-associated NlpC family hydrolase
LLARSVVHTVAEPIVLRTSRAVTTLATAPIRVAYRSVRDGNDEALRGESVEAEEPAVPRAVSLNEPATYNQPFRVAYLAPRRKRQHAPRAEETENYQDFAQGAEEPGNRPTVVGRRAILRNGIACAPERAPQSVKNAIWAANTLRRKPYVWGGGHGSFHDGGYDCSGTISFALHGAGAIAAPLPSSDLMRYGERGRGRWFTIYARPGHTFAVIAGLRLDTTDFQNGGNTGPRWHTDMRDTRGYVARHPAGM